MQQNGNHTASRRADWSVARRRAAVLAALIVVVTMIWVLFGLQLAVVGQLAIGLLGLLTLAIAVAWTLGAVPGRRGGLTSG